MNNANFGFDCRNNANNLKSEPLIDEINELAYIKNIIIFLIIKLAVF